MNMTKTVLLSSALLLSTPIFAEATTNSAPTNATKPAPSYGDNPNLLKVLAVKTQEKVQSTAEKVGAATERGIAKIKPSIDNTWNGTKQYTTEQAVIARDNTREGIDVAVKKVKKTKENIVGTSAPNNVPIERGSLSQESAPTQAAPQYIAPAVNPAPVQNTATVEPEIQRQSLPTQNSATSDDSDAGLPR